MKRIFITILAGTLLLTSCFKDLDQRPVTETETDAETVYGSVSGFKGMLAKIYGSFTLVGLEKGGSNADLSSNNGQDLMRAYFNLQEAPTDEVANTWLSGDKVEAITFMTWDANDPWVADGYYRLYYTIALCNEFLRHGSDTEGFSEAEKADVASFCAETRFIRALAYWMVLDLFGKGPYVDETMKVEAFMPEAYDAAKLFAYIESELKATQDLMPASVEYGRANKDAAQFLLARLYLNAQTYGCGDHYSDCIAACEKLRTAGYSLEGDYSKLFNADNHLRTNEIIFPLVVDATNTVTWGTSTYVVCGQCDHDGLLDAEGIFGIKEGWGSFRVRGNLPALFGNPLTSTDKRCRFYTDGRSQWFTSNIDDSSQGFFCEKWTNLKDDGSIASNSVESGVCTDWPLFRFADVLLMEAEAFLRGGQGITRSDALGLLNQVRQRAYGNTTGDIADADFTLPLILDERGREFHFEAQRRTDLRRFECFTGPSYIWEWKGGTLAGRAVDDRYNLYPIPAAELSANTNLKNDKY
ncbi:MAG: RagB/SusD family nutrient uptake outer membrane protein [Bacteroidales bacterium]|nr:RagB/SusD family nutrient uptake outer membrane protein [Bacteroidales bacterium]